MKSRLAASASEKGAAESIGGKAGTAASQEQPDAGSCELEGTRASMGNASRRLINRRGFLGVAGASAGVLATAAAFGPKPAYAADDNVAAPVVSHVALNIGSDEARRNFSWLSTSDKPGKLQIIEAPEGFKAGDEFPAAGAKEVEATQVASHFTTAKTSLEADVSGLAPATTYAYRVGNDEAWSQSCTFTTPASFEGDFNFIAAGDPQIGTGSVPTDTQGWKNSLALATGAFAPEFLFNMGDQINQYDGDEDAKNIADLEAEYDGFLSPTQMTSLAFVTEVGNHDEGNHGEGNHRYGDSYDMPNRSSYGVSDGTGAEGADFSFMYKGVLFMSLNSNNTSTDEHKAFIRGAMAKHPEAAWTFVSFHHAIFSTANHYTDEDIQTRRSELAPVFSELGVDVVLMGHDHHFTRTYLMDGENPVVPEGQDASNGQGAPATQVAKKGEVFYLTLNSASGSKYYELNKELAAGKPSWAAIDDQAHRPSITDVTVTKGSLVFRTYYTGAVNQDSATGVKPATTASAAIPAPELYDVFTLRKGEGKVTFTDVDYSAWYGNAVDMVSEKGIMNGYSDSDGKPTYVFGVGDALTRAQLAGLLFNQVQPGAGDPGAKNETGMADVADGTWYTAAANWAVKNGVINGYDNGGVKTFGPGDAATCEQMVAIIANLTARGAQDAADPSVLAKFADAASVSGWATKAMAWAVDKGLVNGSNEQDGLYLRAGATVPRERAAAIISNAFGLGLLR